MAHSKRENETSSGIEMKNCFKPADAPVEYDSDLGEPGHYPFTRGAYETMYRGRLWTMRQYAGYSSADESNRRYRYLLSQGTTGLSVAFDLPTQIGAPPRPILELGGRVTLEQLESEHIRRVLSSVATIEEASEVLGIDPSTLYRKRKRYGL